MQNRHSIDVLASKETHWSKVLSNAFRKPEELLKFLELDAENFRERVLVNSSFKMLVPLSYAEKMKKGDWQDPLLQQVLPLIDEEDETPNFVSDPVGDLDSEISSGLLHKYQGRVLLIATGACPVHCRYCFRREFPYSDSIPDKKHWESTIMHINADDSIHEVIFSGGDPLMLSDERLKQMCVDISNIPHVRTIRFHTRVPVFLPERITTDFLTWLEGLDIQKVMVIHSNHANELDERVGGVLGRLRSAGVTLLNQTVLLKGVNDSVTVLSDLMQCLFSYQVLPYYLHQLDRVKGSAHFEVDREVALELVESLKKQLPGYLVPRFVEEVSGERSKRPIVKSDK